MEIEDYGIRAIGDSPLLKQYSVRAACRISLGAKCVCTMEYPGIHNLQLHAKYSICNGEKAIVVGLNECTVDIRLESGLHVGRIVKDVDTRQLFFLGPFQMISIDAEEETHF